MAYRIAGIDVHKKMLAVVVSDVEVDGEYQFERIRYGNTPEHLRLLAERLISQLEIINDISKMLWEKEQRLKSQRNGDRTSSNTSAA